MAVSAHVTRKTKALHMRKQRRKKLCSNSEAAQRLCFRYLDSTILLLSKSEILSLEPSSVAVQPDLCRTKSETKILNSRVTAQNDSL